MALTTTKQRRMIGERIRDERERLGYTELQIAQLLGIPLETYQAQERGESDPGLFSLPRLEACGFDILFIVTGERNKPVQEESELLQRFRELSAKGRASIFMTLDALERLAPNLRQKIRQKFDDTFKDY
ncbi:MAG TPA: transcriptional regulator [Sutterella sp.]|jgi:transcriptional regulator with XRE-family HTH domain|nr:transcriptional regulator [Sutterella sp.]